MATSRVLTLPENKNGRDFVVGDIHGSFDLLDEALEAVGFDPLRDRLIAVGDLVDRGPQSPRCLEYLAQPWFYSVRGNHEEMFMYLFQDGELNRAETIRQRPENGMAWILDQPEELLEDIRAVFRTLPIAIEIESPQGLIGFIHGEVPLGMDWETFKKELDQNESSVKKSAVWSRKRIHSRDESGVDGVWRVFSGHTPVEGGPVVLGNCFFVDTGATYKQIDKNNKQDLFLTLAEIKANADDICTPVVTKDKLVKVTKPKPPAPHP